MIDTKLTMEDAVNIGCVTPEEIDSWYTNDYGISTICYEDIKDADFKRPVVFDEQRCCIHSPHAIQLDMITLEYMAGA